LSAPSAAALAQDSSTISMVTGSSIFQVGKITSQRCVGGAGGSDTRPHFDRSDVSPNCAVVTTDLTKRGGQNNFESVPCVAPYLACARRACVRRCLVPLSSRRYAKV
jgi:hypothetical protein